MRNVDYRVDVLRGGVPYAQMAFSSPPTVYMDADASIKMTLKGEFIYNERVNTITDELRPVMILDGAEYPLGIYQFVTVSGNTNAAGIRYENVEAYDRAIRLSWAKLEHRDYWAAGTAYDTVIAHYLTSAGITHVAFTPSDLTLQSDREDWDIGTPYLEIINTLLAEINYQQIYFDLSGVAQIRPYTAPSADNIQHIYRDNDALSLIRPEYTDEIDLYAKPNVFIAILENPEYETPLVKTAVNDAPGSSLSTISRGIRIPAVYKVSNIASEDELQKYVDRLRDESMQTSQFVGIQTAAEPGHQVGDTVALAIEGMQGLFRETAWSFSLRTGEYMTHTLQRMVML